MLRIYASRVTTPALAALVVLAATGCASDNSTSSTSTAPKSPKHRSPPGSTQAVTDYWRQQVQGQYDGPVALGDGRGCAKASKTRWVCTAHIQNPNKDIDIYGTVTVHGRVINVEAHLNHGNQITKWFSQTRGGCQTNSCKGTRFNTGL